MIYKQDLHSIASPNQSYYSLVKMCRSKQKVIKKTPGMYAYSGYIFFFFYQLTDYIAVIIPTV